MSDSIILNFLNTEGPFETAAYLADMLTVDATHSRAALIAHERLLNAVAMRNKLYLQMVLRSAILREVSTGLWRAWCQDVIDWLDRPASPTGEPEGVAHLPS